jgi:ketosteroid isomerase-like protein
MSSVDGAIEGEVWSTVQALNRAWATDLDPARLADYFAPEMIAITPTDRDCLVGRQACIAGWAGFVNTTTILRWVEKNPKILLLAEGRSAVVAYEFEIDFKMRGRLIQMTGRDLMTFDQREGRFWLVADHFSPTPMG